MKNNILIFFSSCLLVFTNCKRNDSTEKTASTLNQKIAVNGMYSGQNPDLIVDTRSNITFKPEGVVVKSTYDTNFDGKTINEYKSEKKHTYDIWPKNEYGTWVKTNNIIEVTIPNSKKEYYLVQSDSSIILLDENKKVKEGEKKNDYVFTKANPYDSKLLNGTYSVYPENDPKNTFLTLKSINDSIYNVKITSSDSENGCSFEAKGELINNQIDINLNKLDKRYKATMTIEFKNNAKTATIFTTKFDDRIELMSFCGRGGSSITGDYTKK